MGGWEEASFTAAKGRVLLGEKDGELCWVVENSSKIPE